MFVGKFVPEELGEERLGSLKCVCAASWPVRTILPPGRAQILFWGPVWPDFCTIALSRVNNTSAPSGDFQQEQLFAEWKMLYVTRITCERDG